MNIILIVVLFLLNVLQLLLHKKNDGYLKCGYNHSNKSETYRIELDIPIEDIKKRKSIKLKVLQTSENLGINYRLYDLNEEGLNDTKSCA